MGSYWYSHLFLTFIIIFIIFFLGSFCISVCMYMICCIGIYCHTKSPNTNGQFITITKMPNSKLIPRVIIKTKRKRKRKKKIQKENVIRKFLKQDALNLIYRHYTIRIKYYYYYNLRICNTH